MLVTRQAVSSSERPRKERDLAGSRVSRAEHASCGPRSPCTTQTGLISPERASQTSSSGAYALHTSRLEWAEPRERATATQHNSARPGGSSPRSTADFAQSPFFTRWSDCSAEGSYRRAIERSSTRAADEPLARKRRGTRSCEGSAKVPQSRGYSRNELPFLA